MTASKISGHTTDVPYTPHCPRFRALSKGGVRYETARPPPNRKIISGGASDEHGRFSGEGIWTNPSDGSIFRGAFESGFGVRGMIIFCNGDTYAGDVSGLTMHGPIGKYTFAYVQKP